MQKRCFFNDDFKRFTECASLILGFRSIYKESPVPSSFQTSSWDALEQLISGPHLCHRSIWGQRLRQVGCGQTIKTFKNKDHFKINSITDMEPVQTWPNGNRMFCCFQRILYCSRYDFLPIQTATLIQLCSPIAKLG